MSVRRRGYVHRTGLTASPSEPEDTDDEKRARKHGSVQAERDSKRCQNRPRRQRSTKEKANEPVLRRRVPVPLLEHLRVVPLRPDTDERSDRRADADGDKDEAALAGVKAARLLKDDRDD